MKFFESFGFFKFVFRIIRILFIRTKNHSDCFSFVCLIAIDFRILLPTGFRTFFFFTLTEDPLVFLTGFALVIIILFLF